MNVDETDVFPFLAQEIQWIRENWTGNGGSWTVRGMALRYKVARKVISKICHEEL